MQVAFVCPACRDTIKAPASLAGEDAPCPKCGADVDRWPAPVSSPGSDRVAPQPPPVEQAVWFYSANGARRGPVTTTQLRSFIETGMLRANDLVWRDGLPAWVEAGTIPELFPANARAKPAPPPIPIPAGPPPTAKPAARQVVERDEEEDEEDRRPRRRRDRDRGGGFRCPFCGSTERPLIRQQVSPAGWIVFALLLIFTIIFCFIGLFIKEDVMTCRECGARIGR